MSFRTTYYKQDAIGGRNAAIVAPVQTANPAHYGGTMTEVDVDLNRQVYLFQETIVMKLGWKCRILFLEISMGLK